MIVDQMVNATHYPYGSAWEVAFDFLATVDADTEERRYPLQGDEIYAAVESYATRLPDADTARPEAHQRYVDIQAVVAGRERIRWWPVEGLEPSVPYNAQQDIAFYARPADADAVLTLTPGRFAVFFPHDAHLPGLVGGSEPAYVKKVVVKIAARLLI